MTEEAQSGELPLRERLRIIIFEADTPAGKAFDVFLLWAIIASVVVVMIESVGQIGAEWRDELFLLELGFTALFTVEYGVRLWVVRKPASYALSFYGLVDLVAILPTYISFFLPGYQPFLVVRAIRLLRVFRVLKLARFLGEANLLLTALRASRAKVLVFLATLLLLALVLGSAMYLIEGGDGGFTSIPRSMYWAIVTMTTVGYGDIAPQTAAGQALAAVVMLLGYAIIAVPTGIVTAEIVQAARPRELTTRTCPDCLTVGHLTTSRFCRDCGAAFADPSD